MTTDEHSLFLKVKELVIADLKAKAKDRVRESVNSWASSKKETEHQKKLKKGSEMLLEAFKLLKY